MTMIHLSIIYGPGKIMWLKAEFHSSCCQMKDYLVCFKKVQCRVEIGVRVGGLPRDILGVLGTSVVHYELIRSGVCVAVCETVCVHVVKGEDGKRESRNV